MMEIAPQTLKGSKQQSPIKHVGQDTNPGTPSKGSSFLNSFMNQKSISNTTGPYDSIPGISSAPQDDLVKINIEYVDQSTTQPIPQLTSETSARTRPPMKSQPAPLITSGKLEHKRSGAYFGNEQAPSGTSPAYLTNDELSSQNMAAGTGSGFDRKRDTIGFSEKVFEQTQKKQTQENKYVTGIYLWGRNHFGQLALPDKPERDPSSPEVVEKDLVKKKLDPRQYYAPIVAKFDIPVQDIQCGEEHTAILTKDGEIWMVGSNQSGQLGVSRRSKALLGSGDKGNALRNDMISRNLSLASFESFTTRQKVEQQNGNANEDCMLNKYFAPIKVQLPSLEEKCDLPPQIDQPHIVTKLACGDNHTLALTKRGHVYSWGQARYGALGLDFNLLGAQRGLDQANQLRQNMGLQNQFDLYTLGGKFHHPVKDGSGSASYQSLNFKGLDVSFIDSPTMIKQLQMEIIFEISAGAKHSCFAALSNKVFACGSGQQGQLGLGTYDKQMARKNQYKPTSESENDSQKENEDPKTDIRIVQHMYVPDTHIEFFDHIKIKQISCGRYHTLFLTQGGEVYACGQHTLGQLGLGRLRENDSAISSSQVKLDLVNCVYQPRRVELGGLKDHRVQQVSAWTNSACVTIDNDLFIWGSGVFGDSDEPKLIKMAQVMRSKDEMKVKSVKLGGSFMTIQDLKGNIYCWGNAYHKEIRISPHSLLTKKIPKKLLSARDKIEGFATGGAFAIAYTQWKEVTDMQEDDPIWIASKESQRTEGQNHLATGSSPHTQGDTNRHPRYRITNGVRYDQQVSFGSSPETSPQLKMKHNRQNKGQMNGALQIDENDTEKKVIQKKNNQISFDNNVTQFQQQQTFQPGEKDPVTSGGIPSTIGHETIEESPENEIKSEKSLISYRDEDINDKAEKIQPNAIIQNANPIQPKKIKQPLKSQPKITLQTTEIAKKSQSKTRKKSSKKSAHDIAEAIAKLPMPKSQLIKNLMSEIERRKDYDKLTEQVNQLMHDNRELKSQLMTIIDQNKSQEAIAQRSSQVLPQNSVRASSKQSHVAIPQPSVRASSKENQYYKASHSTIERRDEMESAKDNYSSQAFRQHPERIVSEIHHSQKNSQTDFSLNTHVNQAHEGIGSVNDVRSQHQRDKSVEESSKSQINGTLSIQNLEGGEKSYLQDGANSVRPPLNYGLKTKIHSILSDDNVSKMSEASGMSIYKNLSYVKYKEEKERQMQYKQKNNRLNSKGRDIGKNLNIKIWPGRQELGRRQNTQGSVGWQTDTLRNKHIASRSNSRDPKQTLDVQYSAHVLEQSHLPQNQRIQSMADIDLQNGGGPTLSMAAIGGNTQNNSELNVDAGQAYKDFQTDQKNPLPKSKTQQPPTIQSDSSPNHQSPSHNPYQLQQPIQPHTKESVALTVSGSGSVVSVRSDSAFNQTLMSIRETINRCRSKKGPVELRHEYQAQVIDKCYSNIALGKREEGTQDKKLSNDEAESLLKKENNASRMLIVEQRDSKTMQEANIPPPACDPPSATDRDPRQITESSYIGGHHSQVSELPEASKTYSHPFSNQNRPSEQQKPPPQLKTLDLANGERAVYQNYMTVYQTSFNMHKFEKDEQAAHRRTDMPSAAYIAREQLYKSQDDQYRAMMQKLHGTTRPGLSSSSIRDDLHPVPYSSLGTDHEAHIPSMHHKQPYHQHVDSRQNPLQSSPSGQQHAHMLSWAADHPPIEQPLASNSPSSRRSKIMDRVQNIMQSNGLGFSDRLRERYLNEQGAGVSGMEKARDEAMDVVERRMLNDINESANRIEQLLNTTPHVLPGPTTGHPNPMPLPLPSRDTNQKSVRFDLPEDRYGLVDSSHEGGLTKILTANDYLQNAQKIESIISRH